MCAFAFVAHRLVDACGFWPGLWTIPHVAGNRTPISLRGLTAASIWGRTLRKPVLIAAWIPWVCFGRLTLNSGDAGQFDQYLKKELTPSEITIEASCESQRRISRARLERHFVAPGTVIRTVEENGLAGLLFLPPAESR